MKLHIVGKEPDVSTLDDLLNTAPVDWRRKVATLNLDALGECISGLDAIIEKSSMLRGYLDAKHPSRDHEAAVKSSNRLATKVRRALGFTYPKVDITF